MNNMNKRRRNEKPINRKGSPRLPLMSAYLSRKEWEVACWGKIAESKELLQLLTTSYERHNMVMRVAAIDGFVSGKSYRQISKELWLSLQTISGIKKAVNEKSYRSYLERSKKERKKRVYSSPKPGRRRPEGIPRRTKYGILYM